MLPATKQCRACQEWKPLEEYHKDATYGSGLTARCRTCISDTAAWQYESYAKAQKFDRTEEYVISRLAEQPSLSAKLDEMYRRHPKRWHQLIAAAMIKRREEQAV